MPLLSAEAPPANQPLPVPQAAPPTWAGQARAPENSAPAPAQPTPAPILVPPELLPITDALAQLLESCERAANPVRQEKTACCPPATQACSESRACSRLLWQAYQRKVADLQRKFEAAKAKLAPGLFDPELVQSLYYTVQYLKVKDLPAGKGHRMPLPLPMPMPVATGR